MVFAESSKEFVRPFKGSTLFVESDLTVVQCLGSGFRCGLLCTVRVEPYFRNY